MDFVLYALLVVVPFLQVFCIVFFSTYSHAECMLDDSISSLQCLCVKLVDVLYTFLLSQFETVL